MLIFVILIFIVIITFIFISKNNVVSNTQVSTQKSLIKFTPMPTPSVRTFTPVPTPSVKTFTPVPTSSVKTFTEPPLPTSSVTTTIKPSTEISTDCQVSDWSNWSNCNRSCDGGTQERTRSIITAPKGNGFSCPELKQTKVCNIEVCPVDCVVSDWSNWSDCTRDCGGGIQERTRSIITQQKGTGTLCPEVKQIKICNTEVCQLYEFTTHTFTTAGKNGPKGPTLAEIRNAYSGVSWAQNSEFLNMTTQGIQEWKVPATGNYTIRVAGAAGGNPGKFCRGREVSLNTKLIRGEIIKILVGQKGQFMINYYKQGGGGGGTFVVRDTQTAIIVAGGGGGSANIRDEWNDPVLEYENSNGSLSTNGNKSGDGTNANDINGGTNGGGGNAANWRGVSGGGGLIGNGQDSSEYSTGGKSFINGGVGGETSPFYGEVGGFGGFGGGGGAGSGYGGGGGGGGYSGGGAGYGYSNIPNPKSGGGGGSYGITTLNDHGATNVSNGFVIITKNF
jgi:hypothetical protein